jgi:hypothetical protein
MNKIDEGIKRLFQFIKARHGVYLARASGKAKPWTKDPILQRYRFCNVFRENDKVTIWISDNWRGPHALEPDLWFAMAVARWNNHPDTLAEIGYPVPWKPHRFIEACKSRQARGEKVWTGAYMIGTQGNKKDKACFIADDVLTPLWRDRAKLRPRKGDTLASFAARVVAVKNQGRFMVGQMIADTKYATKILMDAEDWATWAISGPGSRRGLNRVMGREVDQHWNDAEWKEHLDYVHRQVYDKLPPNLKLIHAQDLQNCLCEFDKYERVRLGEGKPRSLYPGI